MTRKVLKVGTSAAVTIPRASLEELGVRIGDQVIVEVDKARKIMSIRPAGGAQDTLKIARLTVDFINRYRSDIEALARK